MEPWANASVNEGATSVELPTSVRKSEGSVVEVNGGGGVWAGVSKERKNTAAHIHEMEVVSHLIAIPPFLLMTSVPEDLSLATPRGGE